MEKGLRSPGSTIDPGVFCRRAAGRALSGAVLLALLSLPTAARENSAPVARPASASAKTAPRLTLLTPARGPSGTTVTLVGRNLGNAKGTVLFSGTATIRRWSDRSVTVVLKADRPGRRSLRIRRADGRTSNAFVFDLR